MFTGLVEDLGRVARADRRQGAVVFSIEPTEFSASELGLGDSVAVNGVCLTVTETTELGFTVLAGAETLARTSLASVRSGAVVNLERALRIGDRLGGHLVQGHVDGIGTVSKRRDMGSNLEIGVRADSQILRYVIEKGSITIDGISLTVNSVHSGSFDVALIPHTVEKTTLATKRVGETVNLEVDLIAKYVERLTEGYRR